MLLHTANTLLLFAALAAATGLRARSAFVAALFALHPLHVESVAWIAERKDVLSTFFGLAALLMYVRYALGNGRRNLAASFAFMVASLLSKQTLVTLPFVFLLFDFWPLNRWVGVQRFWLPAGVSQGREFAEPARTEAEYKGGRRRAARGDFARDGKDSFLRRVGHLFGDSVGCAVEGAYAPHG